MAIPIRFAPVLEGDEAIEFYERWQKSLEEPLKRPPTEEGRKRAYEFFKRNEVNFR